jgi:hypothetical protein
VEAGFLPAYLRYHVLPPNAGREEIEREFQRRRLPLPAKIAAGQTAQGSVYFRLSPNPTDFSFEASVGTQHYKLTVDLRLIGGLHTEYSTNQWPPLPPGTRIRAAGPAGTLQVECEEGLVFALDGRFVGTARYSLGGVQITPVKPGKYTLQVCKPGFFPVLMPVIVRADEATKVAQLSLLPVPSALRTSTDQEHPLKTLRMTRELAGDADEATAIELARLQAPGTTTVSELQDLVSQRTGDYARFLTWLNDLRKAEVQVSALFRREYAFWRSINENPAIPPAEKSSAWRAMVDRWEISASENPLPLVWRNHRVDVARGDLRVIFSEPWPTGLAPPKRFIDGVEISATSPTSPPSPLAGWDFKGLPVGTHHLRIVHPAITPAVSNFPIEDSRLTEIRWAPKFNKAQNLP